MVGGKDQHRETVDAFERTVPEVLDVLHAQRLLGDADHLSAVARDLPTVQKVYDE